MGAQLYKEGVLTPQILRELLAATDLTGQSWLDAGCGRGHLARLLAEYKGCHVLGVDASEAMISHCVPHPNTDFRQIGDIGETGLPDTAFDGVLCSSVLEFVSEPSAALFELRRVLKQNGMLLVSVSNSDPIAWFPIVLAHRLTKHLGPWRIVPVSRLFQTQVFGIKLFDACSTAADSVSTPYGVRGVRGFPILGRGTLTMFRAVKV